MMRHSLLLICVVACGVVGATFALADKAPPPPHSRPAQRDVEAIIAEFEATKPPPYDAARQKEPGYRPQWLERLRKSLLRKADLAKELYDKQPDHPRAAGMMVERWNVLGQYEGWGQMARETKQFLDAHPDSPQKADALHLRAAALAWEGRLEESLAVAEQFIALRPDDDERGAYLLETVAEKTTDPARWRELNGRIVETFKGKCVAKWAAARLRRADGVGKPFKLSFNDAVTGKPLALADLKGKVVVVEFWATWCGPCVAEMPKMKQLYADYKDKGVEFIGVSLDQPVKDGGLEKLRLFVAENKITWPQYHQGGGWDSEFSASWGVQSVPTTFMVGPDGNLHSTDASGKVEQLLIELLEKRDGTKRASTQRL